MIQLKYDVYIILHNKWIIIINYKPENVILNNIPVLVIQKRP